MFKDSALQITDHLTTQCMSRCTEQTSVKYAQKFVHNTFGNFPNCLPIILFLLPIMLALCSNMNNIGVKILLLESSIRVFTIQE